MFCLFSSSFLRFRLWWAYNKSLRIKALLQKMLLFLFEVIIINILLIQLPFIVLVLSQALDKCIIFVNNNIILILSGIFCTNNERGDLGKITDKK